MKTYSMPVSGGKTHHIPCNSCNSVTFKPALECEGFSFVRCKNCGLVQRNPQPGKNEIIARYANIYGNDYLSYELKNEAAFFKLQQLALKDAGFLKLEKKLFADKDALHAPAVLDIGCATGALLAHLKARGWRVTGVEISPCAEYARKERDIDVRGVPLEECGFPAESFEVILASHLIEHLNDPKSFLKDVRRILKKDGRIFLTTPNISGFQSRLFGSRWRSAIFDHLFLFSARTLTTLLKAVGFKVERTRTWGGLAVGTAPTWLKKITDRLVKWFNCGDVMIIRGMAVIDKIE